MTVHESDSLQRSAATWLGGSSTCEDASVLLEEKQKSSRSHANDEQTFDPVDMVAAAIGAFSAAAGRNRMARSSTPEVSTGAQNIDQSHPCEHSEQGKEKEKDDLEILRPQLESAHREAEDARRPGAEDGCPRSQMPCPTLSKVEPDVQTSEASPRPRAPCVASPAPTTSTVPAARSPRPRQMEAPPPDVVALEQQLLAERRESEKLRLQLFAALQDPQRDKNVERDKVNASQWLDPLSANAPPVSSRATSSTNEACVERQAISQIQSQHCHRWSQEAARSEPSTQDVEISVNSECRRQRPPAVEASPAWEWLAASEERHERLRPLQNAASASLQAMDGLGEHVKTLQGAVHRQQMPTAELVKLTRQFTKALHGANRQWSMAQAQHAGTLLDTTLKEKETQQWTRDWSDLLAEAQPATLQVNALVKRLQSLQSRCAKIS